jgi:hypothetical protein
LLHTIINAKGVSAGDSTPPHILSGRPPTPRDEGVASL